MFKPAKAILIVAVISGCAFLLSACGGESSGKHNNPNPPPPPPPPSAVITAHATIPSSVTAGVAFTASVSLTSSNNSGGTANVQVVDVGAVKPQINCGQAQTLTIGGGSKSFSCKAPQANLGGTNTHQLQVDVNGKPNLSSPVAVEVVNGGKVTVQLTNAAASAISAAKPGQTIYAAFAATLSAAAVGSYTVMAPAGSTGWSVGSKGGVCAINSQSPSCKVPVTVAASAASGAYTLKVAAEAGSSPLQPTSLSLSVMKQPSPPSTGGMAFDLAQTISDTLYANSGGKTFNYHPVFLFKNTSGQSLAIGSVHVSGLEKGSTQYGCVSGPNPTAAYTFNTCSTLAPYTTTANGPLLAVTGHLNSQFKIATLPPVSAPSPVSATSIAIGVVGNGETYVNYAKTVTFVKYVPGTVAVRVVNAPNSATVYIAATYQKARGSSADMITFNSSHLGTLSTDSAVNTSIPGHFHADQLRLSETGGLLYLPYNNAGRLYLTNATAPASNAQGFNTSGMPNPTGVPVPVPSLLIELTYQQKAKCSYGSACDALYIDQSYVNGISMLGSFNAMGSRTLKASSGGAGGTMLQTADATYGVIGNSSKQKLFAGIAAFFNQYNTKGSCSFSKTPLCSPWAYYPNRLLQSVPLHPPTPPLVPPNLIPTWVTRNYAQRDIVQKAEPSATSVSTAPITRIVAPIGVWAPPSQTAPVPYYNPMDALVPIKGSGAYTIGKNVYYNTYVADLWTYLQNPAHRLYVSANDIYSSLSSGGTPGPGNTGCVLEGQVVHASASSTSPLVLKFQPTPMSKANSRCAPKAYTKLWGPDACGPGGGQACSDTPDLVFEEFNECDFLEAAGSKSCHKIGGSKDPIMVAPNNFFQNEGLWGPNGTYRAAVGRNIAAYEAIGLLPPCDRLTPDSNGERVMSKENAQNYVDGLRQHHGMFANPTCIGLPSNALPTWNVYVGALLYDVNVYTYAFSDFLGQANLIHFAGIGLSSTLSQDLQGVAQPVTIILH